MKGSRPSSLVCDRYLTRCTLSRAHSLGQWGACAVRLMDLASVIFGRSATSGALALLRAYFDESGIHRDSRSTVIAGFIGDAAAWSPVDARWREVLGLYGLKAFHMADAIAQQGEFVKFETLVINDIAAALSASLRDSGLQPVWSGVDAAVWNAATTPEFRGVYPKPYDLCFLSILDHIRTWKRLTHHFGPLALVFATQDEYEDRSYQTLAAWKRNKGKGINSLTFASANDLPALQAADMLVHQLHVSLRSLAVRPDGSGKITITPTLNEVGQGRLDCGGFISETALKLRVANRDWLDPYFPCPTG